MELSPEERQRIYQEEKVRAEAREQIQRELREKSGLAKYDHEATKLMKNAADAVPLARGFVYVIIALVLGLPLLVLLLTLPTIVLESR